jgi:hypothetical protein
MIQRNLPLDKTYSIVSSRHAGMEEGICCDNCNKPISNIAHIKDSDDNHYNVGLDCAETLSGIKDDFQFNFVHKSAFDVARALRKKLLGQIKKYHVDGLSKISITARQFETNKGNEYIVETYCHYPTGRRDYLSYSFHDVENYNNYVFPMIKDLIDKYHD